jgi:hypothetical protein
MLRYELKSWNNILEIQRNKSFWFYHVDIDESLYHSKREMERLRDLFKVIEQVV